MATIGVVAAQGAAVVGFLMLTGCATHHAAVKPEAEVMPLTVITNTPTEVVLPAPLPVASKTYLVKSGDSASKIAKKCGCTTRDLVAFNNLKNANAIRVGQTLKIPDYAKVPAGEEAVAGHKTVKHAAVVKSGHSTAAGAYTVVAGDSLGKLAQQHGTTVAAIKAANNLTGDNIRLGQKLVIPAGKAGASAKKSVKAGKPAATAVVAAVAGTPEGDAPMLAATNGTAKSSEILHVVEANQDLASIAMMYGVRQEDMIKANNLTSPQVTAGQTLKIPPAAMP
ncbi:MAG: LysM peptidoglycan-binding domain-containing protein [bacterium]